MSQRRASRQQDLKLGSRVYKPPPSSVQSGSRLVFSPTLIGAAIGIIVGIILVPIYFMRGEILDIGAMWSDGNSQPVFVGVLFDASAYYSAFARVLEGGTPYAPATLMGPESATAIGSYRYLPPFALFFAPLAVFPRPAVDMLFILAGPTLYAVALARAFAPLRLQIRLLIPAVAVGTINLCALIGYGSGSVVILTAPVYIFALDAPVRRRLVGALFAALAFLRLEIGLCLAALGLRDRKMLWSGTAVTAVIVGISLLFPMGPQAWQDAPIAFSNVAAGLDYAAIGNAAPAVVFLRAGVSATTVTMLFIVVAIIGSLLAQHYLNRPTALLVTALLSLFPLPTIWPQGIAALFPLSIAVYIREGGKQTGTLFLIGVILLTAHIGADGSAEMIALAYFAPLVVIGRSVWQRVFRRPLIP